MVAVLNRKGGAGKTSLTKDLGFALAEHGVRVLQVGLDPQSSLEVLAGLGFDTPPERTVSRLLLPEAFGDAAGLDAIVHATRWGTWLVPASKALATAERALAESGRGGANQRLKRGLAAPRRSPRRFELVLVDCPPGMTPLTMNALVAADRVLVPTQLDFLAARRLVFAFACGAAAGALLAAVMIVGLGDVTFGDATMLVAAVAQLGVLAVAAAWVVERSARWERAAWLATWPTVGAAAGLAAWAPGVPVVPALAMLSLLTAAAVAKALRDCADCSAERHLRRAEARQGAIARSASMTCAPRAARWRRRALDPRPPAVGGCGGCRCRRSRGATRSRRCALPGG